MVTIPLTAAQRDAVAGCDQHLLVTAGAGSGKTSTVVARILHLLGLQILGPDGAPLPPVAEPVTLDRIAAITFTNAAAADLKRKLRDALRYAQRRDLAWQVDTARVGTIHFFCGDLLREFALRGGRDAGLEVLDEGAGASIAAEVARDHLIQVATAGTLPGLDTLLARHGVANVEQWTATLIGDADRLHRLTERARPSADPFEVTLLDLAGSASVALSERLAAEGATTFDRIITDTRDLLRDAPQVRAAVQRRLHTLIIDEFQDVDPAQREIAYLIGAPETQRADSTRLMLVGDPKQSVYRFRRADVTVWEAVRNDFVTHKWGQVVALTHNFRSMPEVLALVDTAIGPLLDAPVDATAGRRPWEVPHLSLAQGRVAAEHPPVSPPGVELLIIGSPDEDKLKAEDRRAVEAEHIARRVQVLLRDNPKLRPRDIAIVATAAGSFDMIEAALRHRQIPTWQQRTDGFFSRREVQDLILTLEVIRDPRDDRALLGWLRSPFASLRDDSLLELVRAGHGPVWDRITTDLPISAEERDTLTRALDLLCWSVARRDRIPLDELLEGVLRRTGWLAHHAAQGESHDQAIANTRKFLRFARQRRDLTVGGLLRLIRDEIEAEVRIGDERLHGGQDEVVTLTSVHSSKGLEWPVVIWCDLERGRKGHRGDLVVGREGLALKDPEAEKDAQAQQWKALLEAEDQEAQAEAKRLWYVASTRARDRLIVTGLVEKPTKGAASAALSSVLPLGADAGPTVVLTHQSSGEYQAELTRVAERPAANATPEFPPLTPDGISMASERHSAPLGRPRHSATSLLGFGRCERRHRFKYRLGIKEPPVAQMGRDRLVDPITRGNIVHDVLEEFAEAAELEGLLEAAIGRWDAGAPAPESPRGDRYRQHLREEVLRIAGHPDYRAIADTPGAVRELSFVQILPKGAFTEGAMDLAAPGPEGFVLLDVKTSQGDREDCEVNARSYAAQRDVYVAAAGAIGGMAVERFAFQFSRAALQVSEPVGPAGTDAARERVIAMAGRIAADADGLAKDPHECRYCGFKEAGWCPGAT